MNISPPCVTQTKDIPSMHPYGLTPKEISIVFQAIHFTLEKLTKLSRYDSREHCKKYTFRNALLKDTLSKIHFQTIQFQVFVRSSTLWNRLKKYSRAKITLSNYAFQVQLYLRWFKVTLKDAIYEFPCNMSQHGCFFVNGSTNRNSKSFEDACSSRL